MIFKGQGLYKSFFNSLMSSSEEEYSDIDVVLYQLRPSDATKIHNNIQEPTPYKIKYNYQ